MALVLYKKRAFNDTTNDLVVAEGTAFQGTGGSSGGTTNQSVAGSMTATGAIARKTGKSLVGSLTMSGILATAKTALKKVVGTMTPTGLVDTVKAFFQSVAGSITSVGAVTRQTAKELFGCLPFNAGATLSTDPSDFSAANFTYDSLWSHATVGGKGVHRFISTSSDAGTETYVGANQDVITLQHGELYFGFVKLDVRKNNGFGNQTYLYYGYNGQTLSVHSGTQKGIYYGYATRTSNTTGPLRDAWIGCSKAIGSNEYEVDVLEWDYRPVTAKNLFWIVGKTFAGGITMAGVTTTIKVLLHLVTGSITATGTTVKQTLKFVTGWLPIQTLGGSGQDDHLRNADNWTTTTNVSLDTQAEQASWNGVGSLQSITPNPTITLPDGDYVATCDIDTYTSGTLQLWTGSGTLSFLPWPQSVGSHRIEFTKSGATNPEYYGWMTGISTFEGTVSNLHVYERVGKHLVRDTATGKTGVLTASGTLTKNPFKILAGIITASGLLDPEKVIGTILKTVTGSITATGAIVKSTSTTVEGAITAVGHAAKTLYETFTGSITATGADIKKTFKNWSDRKNVLGQMDQWLTDPAGAPDDFWSDELANFGNPTMWTYAGAGTGDFDGHAFIMNCTSDVTPFYVYPEPAGFVIGAKAGDYFFAAIYIEFTQSDRSVELEDSNGNHIGWMSGDGWHYFKWQQPSLAYLRLKWAGDGNSVRISYWGVWQESQRNLTRLPMKSVAGAITSAGSVIKSISKKVLGSIVSVGTVITNFISQFFHENVYNTMLVDDDVRTTITSYEVRTMVIEYSLTTGDE